MRIKNKSSDLVVAIIYFLAAIAISIATYSMGEIDLIKKISNSFFSNDAISIVDRESNSDNFEILAENLLRKNALFHKEGYNIYSIFFKGNYQIPMLSGRFFKPGDFNNTLPKAVVGRDIKTVKSVDGKAYYNFENKQYEIIGIMGIKKVSWLDNSVYLSIPQKNDFNKTSPIILDGYKVKENITLLKEKYNSFEIAPLEAVGIERIFKTSDSSLQSLFKYIGIVFMLSIISITSYWFIQKQKLIMILKICGISRFNILKTICIEYSQYALLSFSVGVIFSFLFLKPLFSCECNISTYLVFVCFGILSLLVPSLILNLRFATRSVGRYQR